MHVRRSLSVALLLFVVRADRFSSLRAGSENPTTGTIQGTVHDDDGLPSKARELCTARQSTDTRGVTRTGKDGSLRHRDLAARTLCGDGSKASDMLPVEVNVTVTSGAAATADFNLEWINPGPVHLRSTFTGDVPDNLPINGRNYLNAGQLEPGRASGRRASPRPGKSGYQTLSINSKPDAPRITTSTKSK